MNSPDPQPLVSVIVPAFNAEATLAETLGSVAAQRYPKLEIVIVDDGSTDGTARIASAFADADARARLLRIANSGVAAARNAAIAASGGAWVAPIDADDLWHPDYLAKGMERMRRAAVPPVFVYAGCRLLNARSQVIGSGLNPAAEGNVSCRMLYCNLVGNGSGMIVSRRDLEAVGGYDARLHAAGLQGYEDYLLQLMLAARGIVCAVGEYLVGYRQGPAAMSRDAGRMIASSRLARRLYAAAVRPQPGPDWLRRWVDAQTLLLAAQAQAEARHGARAAALLVRAMGLDPRAAATAVEGRARSWVRRHRRLTTTSLPHFLDVDPTRRCGGSLPVEISRLSPYSTLQLCRLDRLLMQERPSPL